MGVLRSLNIAASGIRAQSEAIQVVSDNIANVNTTGFQRSRVEFQHILGRSIAGANTASQSGAGATLAYVSQVWAQGAILNTEQPTDMAIGGNGLFVVKGNLGGQQGSFYTRAGQFSVDADGMLVNSAGLRLQGFQSDGTGNVTTQIGDLNVNPGTIPATATTKATLACNLDATTTVIDPAVVPFDVNDPANTSNFNTSLVCYDSLGNERQITVYFRKTADNAWDWHALTAASNMETDPGTANYEGASGSLTFTPGGRLDTETTGVNSWDFNGATPGQVIEFDFGTSITTDLGGADAGIDATVQYGKQSTVTGISQNGFSAGNVVALNITADGRIEGVFTNGIQRALGQVALASFASYDGLARAGGVYYTQTPESGEPMLAAAQTGGRGGIQSKALEQSNVDIGSEFVNLISYQRGFQANSKVVQAADELYQELVNLRR